MFNIFSADTKAYKSLNGRDFKEEFSKGNSVLIDVRTAAEFAAGTLPGAKNFDITSPHFLAKVSNLDKSKDYFIFCRSGNRSAQACNIMAEQGYKVYNLKGGVNAWPK
jgi:rhodanese-related sulfurtransferase